MEQLPSSEPQKEKTLKELMDGLDIKPVNLEDLNKFAESFSSLNNEQIAEGLIEGLEHNISEFEKNCKGNDGNIDPIKLRDWLVQSIGIRTLRTGSDINYHWLSDGVFYVEKEIEKLDENSPLRKRAEEAINKVRPIIESFATDPSILYATTSADRWNESSRFVFLRRKD
jgi:hypothetical protein